MTKKEVINILTKSRDAALAIENMARRLDKEVAFVRINKPQSASGAFQIAIDLVEGLDMSKTTERSERETTERSKRKATYKPCNSNHAQEINLLGGAAPGGFAEPFRIDPSGAIMHSLTDETWFNYYLGICFPRALVVEGSNANTEENITEEMVIQRAINKAGIMARSMMREDYE